MKPIQTVIFLRAQTGKATRVSLNKRKNRVKKKKKLIIIKVALKTQVESLLKKREKTPSWEVIKLFPLNLKKKNTKKNDNDYCFTIILYTFQ